MCGFFNPIRASIGLGLIVSAYPLMSVDKGLATKVLLLGFLVLAFDVGYQTRLNYENEEKDLNKTLRI